MAFELSGGIDDLIKDLNQIEIDQIAPVMLEESAVILLDAIKHRSAAHIDTSDMLNSIKVSKTGRNAKGFYVSVRPTGKDRKGVRNMEKMIYLEFGTNHQDATPVLSPAVKATEDPVRTKMQEIFNREVQI